MNKKLMAAAVAGALAAPTLAFAQASNVVLYGRANLGMDWYSATGATAGSASDFKNRARVYDNGSRFGLRGTENLGGGLSAVFVMETGVAMDRGDLGGQSGATNTSVGLAARIGYVGLRGNWGQLSFGRQNIFWTNGQHEQWQANYGSVANQFFTGTWGRGMGVGVARVSNTVQYTSPVMSGFNAVLSYSPSGEGQGPNLNTNGRVTGVTLQGTHGRVIWAWDWAENRGNSPAVGPQSKGTGNKLRGGYLYQPGANISLFYLRMNQNAASGAGSSATLGGGNAVRQNGWGLVWEHRWGNFAVEANYSKLQDISGCAVTANCNNTNNNNWFLGAHYDLSKRTKLMAFYLKYNNAANNNMDFVAGGMSSAGNPTGVANGADPRAYGFGVLHNF